jgi:hypothetical protein
MSEQHSNVHTTGGALEFFLDTFQLLDEDREDEEESLDDDPLLPEKTL